MASNHHDQIIFESFYCNDKNEIQRHNNGEILCIVIKNGERFLMTFSDKQLKDCGLINYQTKPSLATQEPSTSNSISSPQPLTSNRVSSPQLSTSNRVSPPQLSTSNRVSSPQLSTSNRVSSPQLSTSNRVSSPQLSTSNPVSSPQPSLSPTVVSPLQSSDDKPSKEWGTTETKLLLDKYETYMIQVGPMKKFKNKKTMWTKISSDIEEILGIVWTSDQCSTRYKTVMKRKKDSEKNNKTSGSTRKDVEYENEISKISALDDSIEPEVLRGVTRVEIAEKRPSETVATDGSKKKKVRNNDKLTETLYNINKIKEEAKERRHKEKMDLLRELFSKKND